MLEVVSHFDLDSFRFDTTNKAPIKTKNKPYNVQFVYGMPYKILNIMEKSKQNTVKSTICTSLKYILFGINIYVVYNCITNLNQTHNMKDLDDLLRDYRKERQLSQADLAELLNIRRATVADWERRKAYPCLENLKKVCGKLGFDINNIPPLSK